MNRVEKIMSVGQQRKVQTSIMAPLNEACNVINSFKLVDGGHAIVAERGFESIGMLNILQYFEADKERRTILASKHDDEGKTISRRKYITGNVPEADASYIKGLYMIDFRSLIDPKVGDRIAEDVRARIFLGFRRWAGCFELVEDLKEAEIVMMPYAESPSTMKNSRIYYAAVDKANLISEAIKRFNEIDRLSGGSLSYKYRQLLKKDYVTMADVRKIADRLGICTTTPMLKVGHISNIFFMDAELDYGSDYEENNSISAEIGSNFADGSVRFNGETMFPLFKALYPRLKPWMMFGLSLQGRCDTLLMKAHGRFFRGNLIRRYCRAMLKQSFEKCYLVYNGVLYNSKELKRMSKAKLDAMLAKVDVVGTSDEFKAINMDKIAGGCNLYAVAMTNATDGALSNQAVSKVAKDYPAEIQRFCRAAAVRVYNNRSCDYTLRFDNKKSYLKLAGQVYENKLAAAKEKAAKDRHVGESIIKADDSFVRSMTASANIPVNSMYLRLTPDDSIILTSGTPILGGTWVDYYEPGAEESYKVRALEIYCPAFEEKHLTKLYDNMLADTLRMCIGIKYPSQGTDEYAALKCVSLEEIKGRIAKLPVDDELKQDLIEFYETCPNNCVMVPADNTWKNQCAGSDFDGDDFTLYFEEVEYDDDDMLVNYGLFVEDMKDCNVEPPKGFISLKELIAYNKKIEVNKNIPGFTSLAIRKYAVKNNNIGKAAIICYK